MTAFRYEAARTDGARVTGRLDASSAVDAAAVLSEWGLFPLAVEPLAERDAWRWRRPSARAQAIVFRSLSSLAEAGVPLATALHATQRVVSGGLRDAVRRVEQRVKEGQSLASALGAEHGLFSGVTLGLVRAGERGVGLGPALERTAAELEARAELIGRIRGALTYPLILAVVGSASVLFIVGFVVPRFVTVLGDLGNAVPLATRLLIDFSQGLRRFGWLGVLAGGGALAALGQWISTHGAAWHAWLLGLPLVGTIRHGLATARAARTLGALLGTGTPALAALSVAQESAGDAAVSARLGEARTRVAEGAALSVALGSTRALTDGALQLITVGEHSGRLASLLEKAAEIEEREVERRLKTLVTLLEPALIVGFAGVVAFVAAALLQAIYGVTPGVR